MAHEESFDIRWLILSDSLTSLFLIVWNRKRIPNTDPDRKVYCIGIRIWIHKSDFYVSKWD